MNTLKTTSQIVYSKVEKIGTNCSKPGILFCHATGFCKDVWNPVISKLNEKKNGGLYYSLDFSGHGFSKKGLPPRSWKVFRDDVLDVVDDIRMHDSRRHNAGFVGVGHSKGATALVLAEIKRPGTFEQLILFEPILIPPSYQPPKENILSTMTKKRRKYFPSKEAAYDAYKKNKTFGKFNKDSLRCYVNGGLVPSCAQNKHANGFKLCCDPAWEAEVYKLGSAATNEQLHSITCPVKIIYGSDSTTMKSPTETTNSYYITLGEKFKNAGASIAIEACGHFMVMEKPEAVASIIHTLCNSPKGSRSKL